MQKNGRYHLVLGHGGAFLWRHDAPCAVVQATPVGDRGATSLSAARAARVCAGAANPEVAALAVSSVTVI